MLQLIVTTIKGSYRNRIWTPTVSPFRNSSRKGPTVNYALRVIGNLLSKESDGSPTTVYIKYNLSTNQTLIYE